MDTKKLILYAALGIVLFALWSAWQQDYGKKKPVIASQQPIAKHETLVSLPHMKTPPTTVAAPSHRLLTVKTDTLTVAIDAQGGNIVKAGLNKYMSSLKSKIPEQILTDNPKQVYVAQSGLTGVQAKPLQFQAAKTSYTMQKGKPLVVKLTWRGKGLQIVKTFSFKPGSYVVGMQYQIKNNSGRVWQGQYYTQLQRTKPAHTGGLFSLHTYNGAAISSASKSYEKITYSSMDKHDVARDIKGGWAAMQQRYFLSAWIPSQTTEHHYYSRIGDNNLYTIGMITPVTVPAAKASRLGSRLYVGPELTENLKPLAHGLDLTIDFGWLWPISMALFWLMKLINKYIGNWGWSIILITVILRLVFYKLSDTGFRSMMKMRKLAPQMKALKERLGGDRQKMGQATMELYKKEGVNPLSGCLPQLIQIPVLFALYYVLIEAVQLRHAPFIFWIHDLAARDPYYILPILMGISMFLSQKLMPTSPDPTQAKMMMFLPLFFCVLFAIFPAGLVLYYLVNNVLMLLQQWYVMYKYEHKRA